MKIITLKATGFDLTEAIENYVEEKMGSLEKFLAEGHPIEICLRLRGREKYNKDWARLKLSEFLKMITVEHKITSEPKFGGYGLNLQISKK